MKKSRKELFFEETLKLVVQKGFKATTLRDIAHKLDFEVANVYNYIDSKESFLEGYLFNTMDEFCGYLNNIIDSSYSPVEKLKFVISKHVQYTITQPHVVALFIYEWRNLKEPKLTEFKDKRQGYIDTVNTIIRAGIKDGNLREMDDEFATFMVMSSMRWLFTLVTKENNTINPIEIEKQMTDFIFKGIGN